MVGYYIRKLALEASSNNTVDTPEIVQRLKKRKKIVQHKICYTVITVSFSIIHINRAENICFIKFLSLVVKQSVINLILSSRENHRQDESTVALTYRIDKANSVYSVKLTE